MNVNKMMSRTIFHNFSFRRDLCSVNFRFMRHLRNNFIAEGSRTMKILFLCRRTRCSKSYAMAEPFQQSTFHHVGHGQHTMLRLSHSHQLKLNLLDKRMKLKSTICTLECVEWNIGSIHRLPKFRFQLTPRTHSSDALCHPKRCNSSHARN